MSVLLKLFRRITTFKVRYICLTLLFVLIWSQAPSFIHKNQRTLSKLPYVAVHLDFKGAPPSLYYLSRLLPLLRSLGVNALVMEYEDMFPFSGNLEFLRSKNCYTQTELENFLIRATKMGFEIIPLVQTFGHLEYVLKHPQMRHLKEDLKFPDSICPSHLESRELLTSILKQVIDLHIKIGPIKHMHIGCDEIFHLNICEECQKRNLSNIKLYLDHVNFVKQTVTNMTPETVIMIWHDMLRSKEVLTKQRDEFSRTDVVYWQYDENEPNHLDLFNLHKEFENIWIATAYKGADGRVSLVPNIQKRFNNHLKMLNSMKDYKFAGEHNYFGFIGIILTGWSRYSHMDPLCDILQGSLSSLVINLLLVNKVQESIDGGDLISSINSLVNYYWKDYADKFKCEEDTTEFDVNKCHFDDDTKFVQGIDRLMKIKLEIRSKYFDIETGLQAVDFYANFKNMTNKNNIQEHIDWGLETIMAINKIQEDLTYELSWIYDGDTIEEFLLLHTNYETNLLKQLLRNLSKLSDFLES